MAAVRAPGRPRSERAEAAILAATLTLLGEVGFSGLTVDGIAARAGVGKATIYRHWPGKAHVVVDALRAHLPPVPAAGSGDLRSDVLAILYFLADGLTSSPLGRVLPSLVEAAERDPVLEALFRDFGRERRSAMQAALTRAAERGELRPDLDPDIVADLLAGPVFARRLIQRAPVTRGYVEALVDTLLPALRP
jgi:AcrR family transcriptional regulator